jgi:deoxyadenosine/deoxycytidine kinase
MSYPLVLVEANIGAGKSTLARALANRLSLRLLEEPVDLELLSMFYDGFKPIPLPPGVEDTRGFHRNPYSFVFQIRMLSSRWAIQMSAAIETRISSGFKGAIVDRSLFGDRVFAKILMEDGHIHPKEWQIYLEFVENMCMVLFPPTVLLYLDCRPETCLERIQKRGRPQEKGITLDYLRKIHKGYQDLLREAKTAFYPWSHAVEILHVPWDPDTATDRDWDRTADMLKEVFIGKGMKV